MKDSTTRFLFSLNASGALLIFVSSLAALLMGCTPHKELVMCRDLLPKCDFIIENQAADLEQYKLQIGLCNDLNTALMENTELLAPKTKATKKHRRYEGDPKQHLKS